MLKIFSLLISAIVAVQATGQFSVLHSPSSVKFIGQETLEQSLLKDVLSSSLGFTTHKDISWPVIRVTNPFGYAEAVVVITVDGIKDLGENSQQSFNLETNEEELTTWLALSSRVLKRFPSQNNTLIRIELADGNNAIEPYFNLLGDLEETNIKSIAPLDPSIAEDYKFVSQIALLNEIAKKVESGSIQRDGTPDVYWFVVSDLKELSDLHGVDSAPTQKAKSLLRDALSNINNAFRASYDEQVLVACISTHTSHVRRTREVKAEDQTDINLSKNYSSNYAVIFNIILWFSVAFVFAIIATALAIGTMDPGRDSIIYRMTSNRMKKDN